MFSSSANPPPHLGVLSWSLFQSVFTIRLTELWSCKYTVLKNFCFHISTCLSLVLLLLKQSSWVWVTQKINLQLWHLWSARLGGWRLVKAFCLRPSLVEGGMAREPERMLTRPCTKTPTTAKLTHCHADTVHSFVKAELSSPVSPLCTAALEIKFPTYGFGRHSNHCIIWNKGLSIPAYLWSSGSIQIQIDIREISKKFP